MLPPARSWFARARLALALCPLAGLLLCSGCGRRAPAAAATPKAEAPVTATTPPVAKVAPKPPAPEEPPAWTPEPALLDRLGTEYEVAGYRIRLPEGYQLGMPDSGGPGTFLWQGQPRSDGSAPKLWIVVGKKAPGEEAYALEQTAALLMSGMRQRMKDYAETQGRRGRVGEIPFLCFNFQGTDRDPAPVRGHGVVYHAHDGPHYLHLMALDGESHAAETLPLLEAAVRTFRKP